MSRMYRNLLGLIQIVLHVNPPDQPLLFRPPQNILLLPIYLPVTILYLSYTPSTHYLLTTDSPVTLSNYEK